MTSSRPYYLPKARLQSPSRGGLRASMGELGEGEGEGLDAQAIGQRCSANPG